MSSYRDASSLHYFEGPDEEELHRIRERYAGWRIWRSRSDHQEPTGWYATRTQDLTSEQFAAGLYRTIDANSSTELEQLLIRQQELAASPYRAARLA
ncbi:hypothetical protein [Microbispora sp. NPDC046933]|uniref:hypothetical protein n=1 Tax=Microbispora sp. NPDC046933 TaxID=3155618 RepID=UPI00340BADE9